MESRPLLDRPAARLARLTGLALVGLGLALHLRRRVEHQVTRREADGTYTPLAQRLGERPLLGLQGLGEGGLRGRLLGRQLIQPAGELPEEGEAPEELLEDWSRRVSPYLTAVGSPRHFAYVNGSGAMMW